MTHNEKELINMLHQAPDPAQAMMIATDILTRFAAGESEDSIAVSYGLNLSAT